MYRRMHTMGEERKLFVGLGWEKKIKSLGDPDVHFIPSSERDIRAGNQCSNDYDPTSFCNPHKDGGGGCMMSRNNMRKK